MTHLHAELICCYHFQDLEEIGIDKVGYRLRLAKAIKKLVCRIDKNYVSIISVIYYTVTVTYDHRIA